MIGHEQRWESGNLENWRENRPYIWHFFRAYDGYESKIFMKPCVEKDVANEETEEPAEPCWTMQKAIEFSYEDTWDEEDTRD